ncbi:MAG: sigma-54 dependent transcriptional regulator [Bdellovibrionota bacterium]
MSGKVLVIDDEKNITLVIQAMLERAGFKAAVFNDSRTAIKSIEGLAPDLVITDLYMPGTGGMDVLEYCQKNHHQLPVVIITAYGTIEAAVQALKRGAFDFITKPFDQTDLINVVKKAVSTYEQRRKEPVTILPVEQLVGEGSAEPLFSIIGASPQMQEIFKLITKISSSPVTVLIQGESGTGKELVAYEIHRRSDRASKPFIKINCAAVPATLIESELFGYERGAFTGAVSSKPGRFELANEGTIFLDEVADMPLEMQVKLLRVFQEQEFERVGGISTIKVNVRIITATNKDLEGEVKAGRFREDLFYRINVLPIRLPPLRDRKEDVDLLVSHFVKQFNVKLKKNISAITPELFTALRAWNWPGNIRQLENVLERMVLMSDGNILGIRDLPPELATAVSSEIQPTEADLESTLSFKDIVKKQTQTVERELIEKALEETGGNVTKAAEKLGLSRKGLQLKIKDLGIKRPLD